MNPFFICIMGNKQPAKRAEAAQPEAMESYPLTLLVQIRTVSQCDGMYVINGIYRRVEPIPYIGFVKVVAVGDGVVKMKPAKSKIRRVKLVEAEYNDRTTKFCIDYPGYCDNVKKIHFTYRGKLTVGNRYDLFFSIKNIVGDVCKVRVRKAIPVDD